MVGEGMVPTGRGARLDCETVARACWVALSPPGSRAVTVMVALPAPAPVMVTVEPDTDTPATPPFEDEAA